MVVPALLEMDDGVQLRHGGRLFRRRRDDAHVALARMKQQVRPAVAEEIFFEAYFRTLREDGSPLPYRSPRRPNSPNPRPSGRSLTANNCPRGECYLIGRIVQIRDPQSDHGIRAATTGSRNVYVRPGRC